MKICGFTACAYFWRQLDAGGCECAEGCPGFMEMEPDEKKDSGLLEDET